MRSSQSDSPRTLIWVTALLVLLLGGGAVVWLLAGGEDEEAPRTEAVQRPEEEPATPVTFPEVPNPEAEARPIDVTALPTRPRPPEAAVAQVGGPTGDIDGYAVDGQGLPVEGVRVSAFVGNNFIGGGAFGMSREPVDATAVSAADGTFKLKYVPEGVAYVVVGEHDEYARSEQSGIRVIKDRVTTGVKLRMGSGAVIGGTVSASGGGPIEGARVELYFTLDMAFQKPDDHKPWKVVFTDSLGRFAFTHVSSTSIKLMASADDYESQTRSLSFGLEAAPRDMTDINFVLGFGQALPGRTVSEDLLPVPHVRLEATSLAKDFQGTAVAFSDEGGNFRLEGLGTSSYQLRATCDGYSDTTLPKVDVTAGSIQVTLSRRGGVEGWVSDLEGKPIPSFSLHLMRVHGSGEPNYMNDSRRFDDPGGKFVFDNLDPADYVLEARAEEWADTRSESFTVVRNAPALPQLRIAMSRGGTLTGVVRAPDGTPLPGATVKLNPNNYVESSIAKIFAAIAPTDERERKTRSGANGSFSFDHVTPGTWQVAGEHADFAARVINDVTILDDSRGENLPVEVILPPGAGIAGRAIDNGQAPIPFCKVQISQKENGFMDVGSTDADGFFSFRNLREGEYQLTINPEQVNGENVHPFLRLVYASKSTRDIFVSEGQNLDGVVIQLRTN